MTPPNDKDDDPPHLTSDDLQWIRQQRKEDAHAEWLRGQIRVIYPWVIAVVSALVGAAMWIKEHVRL